MTMVESGLKSLQHCRAVFLRVVDGLSNDQLDFLMFPESKSIGELILHVAGFEFLMISEAGLLGGDTPDYRLWHRLKPGFSRETGFPLPRGRPLGDYIQAIAEVRGHTARYFGEKAERRMVTKTKFPIGDFATLLRDNDPEGDAKQYDTLAAAVGTTFRDDGAENERGEVDLITLLQLHEVYHRGHITLLKYIHSRLQRESACE